MLTGMMAVPLLDMYWLSGTHLARMLSGGSERIACGRAEGGSKGARDPVPAAGRGGGCEGVRCGSTRRESVAGRLIFKSVCTVFPSFSPFFFFFVSSFFIYIFHRPMRRHHLVCGHICTPRNSFLKALHIRF